MRSSFQGIIADENGLFCILFFNASNLGYCVLNVENMAASLTIFLNWEEKKKLKFNLINTIKKKF